MTRRNLFAAVVAAGVLAAVGCGPNKLNEESRVSVESLGDAARSAMAIETQPQRVAQTVKVEVTMDNPVNVYVLLKTTAAAASSMDEHEVKSKAVQSKTGVKSETFSVPVPAGDMMVVWVGAATGTRKATGTVKMTN